MDLVSVIVPVYKIEDYLDRCVKSVVRQTYTNLEIILVDDGSPDRCPQICDEWSEKDPRIRVIHQKNGGLSAARNAGLEIAKGEYFLLLDSDDYISIETVEHLLYAVKAGEADIAICGFLKGSEEKYRFQCNPPKEPEVIDAKSALLRIYSDDSNALKYGAACFKLYRRALFSGIYYPLGKLYEDIYTTHKLLAKASKIAVLDEPLYYYYQRPSSIMNTKYTLQKLDYLQALVERVAFFREHDLAELEQIAYDELLHALIWEYSRTRDILHSREGMDYVTSLFRENYRKGYASRRYPKETRRFLTTFNRHPELIVWYWKISGKLRQIFKRR